jgi:hypothetical protein
MARRTRQFRPLSLVWTWSCPASRIVSCVHIVKSTRLTQVTDGKHLLKAVRKGKIPMERIDDMARR